MAKRCDWCLGSKLMVDYHDTERGVPLHNDRKLFEYMVLDAFQAGLSWSTILNKRENFRGAFDQFNPEKIARYDRKKLAKLMADAGIVRNRLKIEATVQNARAFLDTRDEFGSFDEYIWRFVGGRPRQNAWKAMREIPARTEESDLMSKDLKKRGFRFVGSTICYAFMQAAGMVNDHVVTCYRHASLRQSSAAHLK